MVEKLPSGGRSFILLYLKSFSVDFTDEIDEKKLLDYMNREQRRKSIVDRISQVTLTLTDDALVLSKPLWWSTRSGQRLPYTQLREAYVFGKDHKRIGIDILSLETRQRRVLLFKTRNLDEREALIELLTQRKMAREMYEKDNIHPVQYANWTSTYADDASYHASEAQSPVSMISMTQSPPESPVFVKPRSHSLARQPIEQPMKHSLPRDRPAAEQMQLVPVTAPTHTMREVIYQSETDPRLWALEQWRDGDRKQLLPMHGSCCGYTHCHGERKPSEQHTNINIVFHGQPVPVTTSTSSSKNPGYNPSQMNHLVPQTPTYPSGMYPDGIHIETMPDSRYNTLNPKTPSQWDYTGNAASGNNIRVIDARRSPMSVDSRSSSSNSAIRRYPSQMAIYKADEKKNTLLKRTVSQPDMTITVNGEKINYDQSMNQMEQHTTQGKTTFTNAYKVINVPVAGPKPGLEKGHTYHTTLLTKAGQNSPTLARSVSATPTRVRDEVVEERTVHTTYQTLPQKRQEVQIMPSTLTRQMSDAHHGWATETKFYEVRNNSLAKVTRSGSRYATISRHAAT